MRFAADMKDITHICFSASAVFQIFTLRDCTQTHTHITYSSHEFSFNSAASFFVTFSCEFSERAVFYKNL